VGKSGGVRGFGPVERTSFREPLIPDIGIPISALQFVWGFPGIILIPRTLPPKCIMALRFEPRNLLITNLVALICNHFILFSLAKVKVRDWLNF
jgi:hypothetical protein